MQKLILSVFILMVSCSVKAQTEKQIAVIDSIKKEIKTHLSEYRKIQIDSGIFDDHFKFIKDNEVVCKTSSDWIKNDSGKFLIKTESYYSKNKLVYLQELWTYFGTENIYDDYRIYIDGKKLIALYKFGKLMDSNSTEFKRAAIDVNALHQ